MSAEDEADGQVVAAPVHERWAHLRFSVVGRLLAAPPAKGELGEALEELSQQSWRHPVTGKSRRFGFSTIEHWYYAARAEKADPVGVLRANGAATAGSDPRWEPRCDARCSNSTPLTQAGATSSTTTTCKRCFPSSRSLVRCRRTPACVAS